MDLSSLFSAPPLLANAVIIPLPSADDPILNSPPFIQTHPNAIAVNVVGLCGCCCLRCASKLSKRYNRWWGAALRLSFLSGLLETSTENKTNQKERQKKKEKKKEEGGKEQSKTTGLDIRVDAVGRAELRPCVPSEMRL